MAHLYTEHMSGSSSKQVNIKVKSGCSGKFGKSPPLEILQTSIFQMSYPDLLDIPMTFYLAAKSRINT